MRVLGIETSSRRGTLALLEDGRAVAVETNAAEGAHAERFLPMLDAALASSGWGRSSLDRIGVGVGPGSFTGMRVGVALAQGIGLGLDRPVLGVGSLRAMCRGVPDTRAGVRCALLDARRTELFAAVYGLDGAELVAPCLVPRAEIARWLAELDGPPAVVVGEVAAELAGVPSPFRSDLTDLPHAVCVGRVAGEGDAANALAEPAYVRPADAIRPRLPRSPLSSGDPR